MGARIGENRADLTFRCSSHRATYYRDCKQFMALSTWVITVSSLCSECSTAPHSGLAGVVVAHGGPHVGTYQLLLAFRRSGRRVLWRNSNSICSCSRGARGVSATKM